MENLFQEFIDKLMVPLEPRPLSTPPKIEGEDYFSGKTEKVIARLNIIDIGWEDDQLIVAFQHLDRYISYPATYSEIEEYIQPNLLDDDLPDWEADEQELLDFYFNYILKNQNQ